MKPQFDAYLSDIERRAVNTALLHGLPCVPDTYARSEMMGMHGGFLERLPFTAEERVVIAGDPFGLLTESMLKADSTRHITIWESDSKLHAFTETWFSEQTNVQLVHQSWTASPPIDQQTNTLVLWELPFLISDIALQRIIHTLHSFIEHGGRICIRHTSPQYLEEHPQHSRLLNCPIRQLKKEVACADFSMMNQLATTLECKYRSISSIHTPHLFLTILTL